MLSLPKVPIDCPFDTFVPFDTLTPAKFPYTVTRLPWSIIITDPRLLSAPA